LFPRAKEACGIACLDALTETVAAAPVDLQSAEKAVVGAVQDLLTGHGYASIPNLLSQDYGTLSKATVKAFNDFRGRLQLPAASSLDPATLTGLVQTPATDPRATQTYLTLALGVAFEGVTKVLALVSQMEGAGRFSSVNLNSDGAGLSFGLIQWAQKPGRLAEIVDAFQKSDAAEFARVFGGEDKGRQLLAHLRKPSGGVDPQTGKTTDAGFDLIAEPWLGRFRAAGLSRTFQVTQVRTAAAAFSQSVQKIRQYAKGLESERAMAFMIDLANQHGDTGAKRIYMAVQRPGMSERELLEAMANRSLQSIPERFQTGVRNRRETFLSTAYLSDAVMV
jgi:hypothetical protein